MKYILTIIFILNLSVWVWSLLLPKPNKMLEFMNKQLTEDRANLEKLDAESDKNKTKPSYELRVNNAKQEIDTIENFKGHFADSYHIALKKQQLFNTVIKVLLPVNAFAVFILIFLLTSQYKKEEKPEQKDSGNGVPPSQI